MSTSLPPHAAAGSGFVLTDFGIFSAPSGYGVDIQADGKILVAGQIHSSIGHTDTFCLLRYNADGSLDTSFSSDGRLVWNQSSDNSGESVIAQASGKILVGGYSGNDDTDNYNFALTSHNSDGSFDTSFGGGDGQVVTSIGVNDKAHAMSVQANGKILLGGESDGNFALVRYNTNGSLDTSFSDNGIVTTDLGKTDVGESLTLQSDGKILLAGYSRGAVIDFALVRYNSNGTLDTSFSGDGKVITSVGDIDGGFSVVVQADNKILVSGTSDGKFAIVRYTSNGNLDNTFSGDGKVETDFSAHGDDNGFKIVLLGDGKFLVAGAQGGSEDGAIGGFALARYNANGTLDTSFSSDGKVTSNLPGDDYAYQASVQKDGKIVICGETHTSTGDYIVLVRYNVNGTLDTTFGAGAGTLGNDTLTGTSAANALQGLAGNDSINGAAGNDKLEGGLGADLLNGSSGNDLLFGGDDADTFRFASALSASTNVDTIQDFDVVGGDVIQLYGGIFTKLTVDGALNAANFRANISGNAADSNDYIVYETDTGKLFYDADGNGAGAKVQFALIGISIHPALTASDFLVI